MADFHQLNNLNYRQVCSQFSFGTASVGGFVNMSSDRFHKLVALHKIVFFKNLDLGHSRIMCSLLAALVEYE